MDYKLELQIVKELNVEGTLRTDCPFCMNRNTFDVTNKDGVILWNCFHASCEAKGGSGDKFSKEDVERFVSQEKQLHNHNNCRFLSILRSHTLKKRIKYI